MSEHKYPVLKGISACHPWQQIHQWLCEVMGAEPARLRLTDPVQQFNVTVDMKPLMEILGGEWEDVVIRAMRIKKANSEGSNKRGIVVEGEEGSFLASLKPKVKPPEGAKEFRTAAGIGTDADQYRTPEKTEVVDTTSILDIDPGVFNICDARDHSRRATCLGCSAKDFVKIKDKDRYLCASCGAGATLPDGAVAVMQ